MVRGLPVPETDDGTNNLAPSRVRARIQALICMELIPHLDFLTPGHSALAGEVTPPLYIPLPSLPHPYVLPVLTWN